MKPDLPAGSASGVGSPLDGSCVSGADLAPGLIDDRRSSISEAPDFMESDTFAPGNDITLLDTPWGRVGLCVCFDLRFEELCRVMTLRGARMILAPAAFNMTTGPAHWELLLRQRAVDNQCFTVGTSPARDESASYVAWGNSMVCDPWGTVLHCCGAGEEVAVTELDMTRIDAVRRQLPILSARRTDVYELRRV